MTPSTILGSAQSAADSAVSVPCGNNLTSGGAGHVRAIRMHAARASDVLVCYSACFVVPCSMEAGPHCCQNCSFPIPKRDQSGRPMSLDSQVQRHAEYFEANSILFDTCGLTWFAKQPGGMATLQRVLLDYRVIVPTPVLYELAFGPDELVEENEAEIRKWIHDPTNCVDVLNYTFAQRQGLLRPNGFLVVNPGFNEWWTARTRLLSHIGGSPGTRPAKAKREYSLDALIHATARNCFAPVCTANTDDFEMMNAVARQVSHDGSVPLFHPRDIARSLGEVVVYSEPT